MELKDIYKINPRVINVREEKRVGLIERRKSKRQDCFDQRRNYTDPNSSNENQESQQAKTISGKENRRDLLKKWKEDRKKENLKKDRKPFVVGVVRHNVGSPLFRNAPLKDVKPQPTVQVTKPEVRSNKNVFCFGKQKPTLHQFKVSSSVKKLTVPITPSFMGPTKRGNLADKTKDKKTAQTTKVPAKTKPIKVEKPAPSDKRVTRATTKGAKPRSPEKRVNKSKNVPSTSSSTDVSAQKQQKTPDVNRIKNAIDEFVLSPPVRLNKNEKPPTPFKTIEGPCEVKKEIKQEMMETEMTSCDVRPGQEYYDRLQTETDFLLQCCDDWTKTVVIQKIPQEVSDEIDSVLGKAKLLVNDKFNQFRNLIIRYEEDSEPPVTSEDLEGFWDLIYIQIKQMRDSFDRLSEIKNNNWIRKTQVLERKKVAFKPKENKKVVKSRFREFMAKKKEATNVHENDEDNGKIAGGLSSESIQSNTGTPVNTPLKERMMQQVLNTSRSGKRRSSIASATCAIRTSLIGKNLAMSPLVQNEDIRKSILKNMCPSPSLTPAEVIGETKRKVGFGKVESILSVTIDDTADNILLTPEIRDSTNEIMVTPATPISSETNLMESGEKSKSVRLRTHTPYACLKRTVATSDSDDESEDLNTSLQQFKVTPRVSRKSVKLASCTPEFTPRRSARLEKKAFTPHH